MYTYIPLEDTLRVSSFPYPTEGVVFMHHFSAREHNYEYTRTEVCFRLESVCEQAKDIVNNRGTSYIILKVTDGDITYTNQKGNRYRESADLFRRILARVQSYGSIQQSQLRGEFGTYASAFVTTVFSATNSCKVTANPNTIRLKLP